MRREKKQPTIKIREAITTTTTAHENDRRILYVVQGRYGLGNFFFIIFGYCYYYYKLRMRLLPFGYIFDNVCTVAMNGDAVLLRRNGIQFFGAEKAFAEFLTIYTPEK